MGAFTKSSSKTFPSELVQTFPGVSAAHHSLPGVMSSLPLRNPTILWANLLRMRSPAAITAKPGQLLTWETRTYTNTHGRGSYSHLQPDLGVLGFLMSHCGNRTLPLIWTSAKAAEGLSLALSGKVSVSLPSHYSGHWFWRSWWLRGGQIDGSDVWKRESCSISISRTDTTPHICHAGAQTEARIDGM